MEWGQIHFLRPGWFLLLLPIILLTWVLLRRQDYSRSWKKVIAPQLLEHLALPEHSSRSRLRPLYLLILMWCLSVVALAGPAWQREPTPFTEDQAALFIVLKVTPEMLAQDIQPSRLKRSVQKIGELLARRPGSKTGLVAYSGTAHLVMPLTSDPDIISYFAAELDPAVMPTEGDDPLAAVELAAARLQRSGLPGSIVLIADRVDVSLAAAFEEFRRRSGLRIHVYATAAGPEVVPPVYSPPAPALDRDAMQTIARAAGGRLVLPTVDEEDVVALAASIEQSIANAPLQEGERWKDAGRYLLYPICLLMLPFFRRGGGVQLRP